MTRPDNVMMATTPCTMQSTNVCMWVRSTFNVRFVIVMVMRKTACSLRNKFGNFLSVAMWFHDIVPVLNFMCCLFE